MITARRWTLVFTTLLVLFVAVNGLVWTLYTADILGFGEYWSGGIDRLGYVAGSKHYRKREFTLPIRVIENADYRGQPVDLITIGDSFSNLAGGGRDPLYQDWIASVHGITVLNVQPLDRKSSFETLILLYNSGYIEKIRPSAILLETVERSAVRDHAREFDFTASMPSQAIEDIYRTKRHTFKLPDMGFVTMGNFKFLLYTYLRRYSDNAFFTNVYTRKLDAPFFSVKNERLLLFWGDDVDFMGAATDANIRRANDNMNRLADLVAGKGIRFYFMPAADKYNIYRAHIVDNPYPKSAFFETMRKLPKRYTFIDTEAILSAEVARGEKDVYYADDSHWSWKGARKIAESVSFPSQGRRKMAASAR